MQKKKPRGSLEKFAACRVVLPGYPKAEPFKTLDEVEQYATGERVACLLCGKEYKVLSIHLWRIHALSAEDYKLRYNIPARFALTATETSEKHRAHGLSAENLSKLSNMRCMPGFNSHDGRAVRRCDMSKPSADHLVGTQKKKHQDFSWHLYRAGVAYNYQQIALPRGAASWSCFKKRRKADPALQAAFAERRAKAPKRPGRPKGIGVYAPYGQTGLAA